MGTNTAQLVKSTVAVPKPLNKGKLFAYHKSSAANDPNNAIIKASKTIVLNE